MGDEQVAVFHLRNGTLRALAATCPHRGGPLADGLIDNDIVVCPLHGLTYDLRDGTETSSGADPVRAYTVGTDSHDEIVIERRSPDSGASDGEP